MEYRQNQKGVPKIEVTFTLDKNRILNVNARDKSSGKSENITITNENGRLSSEKIQNLIENESKFKEEEEKIENMCIDTLRSTSILNYSFDSYLL